MPKATKKSSKARIDPLHLPGYNYCGPGTDLTKNLPPINDLDAACKRHDEAYADPNVHTLAADMNLALEALGSDTYAGSIVSASMVAKNILAPFPIADYFLRPGQNMEVDEVGTEAAPAAAGGGDTKSGQGAGSSGGGEVSSLTSIAAPMSLNRWTRVIKNRSERVIWNTKSKDWAEFKLPGQTAESGPAGEYRWTDYFTINDRILGFYLTPTQLRTFKNQGTIAFKIKSAHWKIIDSKVYVHSMIDGTTKYANYQGVDPYIYTVSNPDIMPTYTWQSWSDQIPTDGEPADGSTSVNAIMDGECQSKFRRTTLPRIITMRPSVPIYQSSTGTAKAAECFRPSEFTSDKSADFEYRHLTRLLASALPGSGRSLQTWPNWIRNQMPCNNRATYTSFTNTATRGTWNLPISDENYGLNGVTNSNPIPHRLQGWTDIGMFCMPVGPFSEDPTYTFLNPWTNAPPTPYELGRGNTPMWMKLEDIAGPDGILKEVSVVFTIESEIVIECTDEHNACTDFAAFNVDGNLLDTTLYSARHNRLLGDDVYNTLGVTAMTKGSNLNQTGHIFDKLPDNTTYGRSQQISQFGQYFIPYWNVDAPRGPFIRPPVLHEIARTVQPNEPIQVIGGVGLG